MHLILPLNTRTQAQEQQIDVSVVFPGFMTIGRPRGAVRLTAELLTHGDAETFGVAIDLTIPIEDGHSVHKQRFAYRPDELTSTPAPVDTAADAGVHNAKTRKKER